MKKIFLTLAGSSLLALAAVNAQERNDTTRTQQQPSSDYRPSESGTQGETGTIEGKSGTQGQQVIQWRDEDREAINREDLPQDLMQTLDSDQYEGWENATIYRNKTTQDYMLVLQDNGSTRTFYFDSEGKEKDFSASGTDEPASSGTSDMNSGTSGSMNNQPGSTQDQSLNQNQSGSTQDQSSNQDQSLNDETVGPNSTVAPGSSSGTTTPSGVSSGPSMSTGDQNGELQTTHPDHSASWKAEDKVIILADDVPSSLRVTLEGDDFEGWQNSTIYQNRATNEYMIEIRDGSNTKVYYFDKEGKLLSNAGNNE